MALLGHNALAGIILPSPRAHPTAAPAIRRRRRAQRQARGQRPRGHHPSSDPSRQSVHEYDRDLRVTTPSRALPPLLPPERLAEVVAFPHIAPRLPAHPAATSATSRRRRAQRRARARNALAGITPLRTGFPKHWYGYGEETSQHPRGHRPFAPRPSRRRIGHPPPPPRAAAGARTQRPRGHQPSSDGGQNIDVRVGQATSQHPCGHHPSSDLTKRPQNIERMIPESQRPRGHYPSSTVAARSHSRTLHRACQLTASHRLAHPRRRAGRRRRAQRQVHATPSRASPPLQTTSTRRSLPR
jgi:hypothetical protein